MAKRSLRTIERLDRVLDGPMSLLSLIMVAIILAQLSGELNPPYDLWADWASLAIWGTFVVEFAVKLMIVANRREYLQRHWFDVIILVLPMLRFLRALRILRLTRTFVGIRFAAWLVRGVVEISRFARYRHLGNLTALTLLVVLVSAFAEWRLEEGAPGSPLQSYGTALWWSAALVTTIDSGMEPVTVAGRILSLLVRLYAVAVFVYLVSALTSYWFGPPQPATEPTDSATDDQQGDQAA